jgi:hypothetical protein
MFAAFVLLWVRSHRVIDIVNCGTHDRRGHAVSTLHLYSSDGVVTALFRRVTYANATPEIANGVADSWGVHPGWQVFPGPKSKDPMHWQHATFLARQGFAWESHSRPLLLSVFSGSFREASYRVAAPYWLPTLLTALAPAASGLKSLRRRLRRRRNLCPDCAYDIRASSERCPECGTPIRGAPQVGVRSTSP